MGLHRGQIAKLSARKMWIFESQWTKYIGRAQWACKKVTHQDVKYNVEDCWQTLKLFEYFQKRNNRSHGNMTKKK